MSEQFDTQNFLVLLGNKLLEIRKKNGLNQEEAATLAGYDGPQRRMNFFRIEHGINDIPITRLARFCAALNIPLGDILTPELTVSSVEQLENAIKPLDAINNDINNKIVNKYNTLTEDDKRLVDTMIETMLSGDKYKEKEAVQSA